MIFNQMIIIFMLLHSIKKTTDLFSLNYRMSIKFHFSKKIHVATASNFITYKIFCQHSKILCVKQWTKLLLIVFMCEFTSRKRVNRNVDPIDQHRICRIYKLFKFASYCVNKKHPYLFEFFSYAIKA